MIVPSKRSTVCDQLGIWETAVGIEDVISAPVAFAEGVKGGHLDCEVALALLCL